MPLEESDASLKLVRDDGETSLFTYTFTTPNSVDGTSQLLLQNNLTDDNTMYLQGLEDGSSTGWTLDGLPVLFPNVGQPILLNQDEIVKINGSEDPDKIYINNEPTDQIFTTVNDKDTNIITTVLDDDLNIMPDKLLNINGLVIPIYQIKETAPIESPKRKQLDIDDIADTITTYKCKQCNYSSENKADLLNHYRESHLENQFQIKDLSETTFVTGGNFGEDVQEKYIWVCSQCSKGFDSIDDCKQHMINDHKLKELSSSKTVPVGDKLLEFGNNNINETINGNTTFIVQANVVDKPFLEKKILKPRTRVNASLPFKCQVRGCSYRFGTETVREAHTKCHIIPENGLRNTHIAYQCSECNVPQVNWRTTALHLWRQHNIQTDLIACPICFVFKSTVAQLENHMMIHSDKKSHTCPQCGKLFKQASQLRNHWIIHIDKGSDKRPSWFREIECPQCHKMFSSSKSLKKHLQSVHSKLKPFICNVCGHSCARKAMLQMHLRQHTGEKPYACPVCNYRTGDHNTLRRHKMIHTGMKPYKCPHCPYTSIQSSTFKNHMTIKHAGKTGMFSCKLCKFQSVSENTYSNHLNDHEQGIIPATKIIQNTATSDSNQTSVSSKNSSTEEAESTTITTRNTSSSDNEEPCYLRYESLTDEPSIDTGGITIPAEPECSSLLQMALLT